MNTFYVDTFHTFEHKQKYVRKHTSKKSKSYDNTGKPSFTERKGAASSNKRDSYKHVRSMKREWREE